ncbi:transcriptional regulator [Bacillus thuringiensis]|nr:transcriptional regulator [Bacillus thuringiensis]
MSFMKETVNRTLPIWDACVETPFLQELKEGTLPMEKFKQFLIQDSIYLKHNARVYGKAIYHSTSLRDIQLYYSILSFIDEAETSIRLSYLKKFGLTDDDIHHMTPLPENQNCIDFILSIAEEGNIGKILMTVMPCLLSYSYIFRKLASEPGVQQSKYWDFIVEYTDEGYASNCVSWCSFVDEKCDDLPAHEKAKLAVIFEKVSLLELDFWHMAYKSIIGVHSN